MKCYKNLRFSVLAQTHQKALNLSIKKPFVAANGFFIVFLTQFIKNRRYPESGLHYCFEASVFSLLVFQVSSSLYQSLF